MPYPKQKPEYFLRRIKEFHAKHNRAPRSNEFNGPFHQNVVKYFGSWAAGVKKAIDVDLTHAWKGDDELLQTIRSHYQKTGSIPTQNDLTGTATIIRRFGSLTKAIEAATGINVERRILAAIDTLTGPGVQVCSLNEIATQLRTERLILTMDQTRGLINHCTRRGEVHVTHGDRLSLYSLTSNGKNILKGEKNGNRTR